MEINKPAVRKERTGWRDESISQRHREWGWDCPAVDIDFLLVEYDRACPVAIIEYKHEKAPLQYATHPSYRALSTLATDAGRSFFAVRYAGDFSWWKVTPLNEVALSLCPERVQYTESEYVAFLHGLRKSFLLSKEKR